MNPLNSVLPTDVGKNSNLGLPLESKTLVTKQLARKNKLLVRGLGECRTPVRRTRVGEGRSTSLFSTVVATSGIESRNEQVANYYERTKK